MATDFWSEYRRLKKKNLEDTNVNAPVKETTTSSSSDEGSVFWDEYRKNKKDQITSTATETSKKEEKEKEEKKAEQKTLQKSNSSTNSTNSTSDKLVNGKLMQTQTKQVIKEDGVSPGDIAPVKTHGGAGGGFGDATDGKNDSWIKKSEGNWWQTILGSGTDLTEHVTAGAIGVGEKIVDALTTVGTLIGQTSLSQTATDEMLYNAIHGKEDENVLEKYEGVKKESEKKSAEFIAKDLYDEEAIAKIIISDPMRRKYGINSEGHSIFGEKSDELAMSAGQLGVQLGANVLLPGSGIAVMGASTFGSEVESAFRNGATFGEAVLSASISTAAEVLTERIGGVKFGGKTLSDAVFGELSSKVTGKFARALVSAGKIAADATSEAVEEIVSGYISAWGQTLSYMDDKEIEELFSKEDALDAAIGGFVLGGAFSVGEAAITGRDPASGLTKNEQAVVDKEVERRVAEQEKGGEKLTTKDIGAIKKQVQDDMEHGQLDIEMIEEVLGGDSYTAYKDMVKSEDGLKDEYDQLADIKKSDLTTKQEERLAELKAMNLGDTTKRDDLRKKLNETVFPQLKDSKLAESYNQVAKKGEAFKVDLSKYKGKQREAVERAMKSGVLNDTFRSHELVDVLSKIEAEKGIVFDYTNNAKLKESGFALEGKTVNGFANKKQGSVTLNVQSAKAWQSVVGHEITHVLETNPEAYKALRESLYAYAESRGELESRRAETTALYDGMDADIEAELTADLVGDYLFTDKNFVNKLAGNRTLFQKVYDEIKYLWNVATGKEKTEIEKVKDEFDRVWKEYGREKVQESESQEYSDADLAYSISEIVDENGKSYGLGVKLDSTLLDDLTPDERVEMVKLRVGELGGQPFTAYDRNGKAVNVMIAKSTRKFKNKNGGKSFVNQDLVGYNKNPVKQEAVVLVDELITASTFKGTEPAKHPHGWVDDNGKNDWDVWETYIQDKNKTVWKAQLRIANSTNGEKILYDIFPIEKVGGVKTLDTTPTDDSIAPIPENVNTKFSLSSDNKGESYAPVGNYSTPFRELALDAPVAKADAADNNVGNIGVSDNVAPIPVEEEETVVQDAPVDDIKITTAKERIGAKLSNTQTEIDRNNQLRAEAKAGYDEKIAALQKLYDGKKNKDTKTANNILRRIERLRRLSGNVDADYAKRISDLEGRRTSLSDQMNQDHTKADRLELAYARIDRDLEQRMAELDSEFAQRRAEMEESLADRNAFISEEAGRLYDELASLRKGVRASKELGYLLDHGFDWKSLKAALVNVKRSPGEIWNVESEVEPLVREAIAETYDARAAEFAGLDSEYAQEAERLEADAEAARADARKAEERLTRKALHQSIVEKIKTRFAHLGYDFDTVLKRAKDLSTFATVDNTPQRVLEKSLGYEEGGILADLTVNQVAQNESEAIRWLNSFTNRKSGLLAELSRQYRIKPGSKESAAAQMYAEGFYVGKNDEIIAYSDNELAIDFPDTATQDRIKGLARDPRIRLVYDQTLDMINESRTRNAYPEIPRLDNYFLHFRAMEDTFSKLGLPFNPNDIRAKDLPTDLNGVTADLKPGQPYFASAMHREGNRTSFDLLGGMERYLSSAKNQIFHIDDIQTLRALRNYIADTYGQANGLESLDSLTEEEVQDRIKDVFGAHLSTFAKFLNEEANIIAGKTSLADRGIEGILGRRAITFLNDVNRQVGANMVGYNASSALTNFIPVVQTFAKANKTAFVKAFAQTVSNRIGGIAGRSDGFAEASPVMIRRAGADRFHRTLWQKMSDPGYALMGAVDSISTEIVARTKYNELTKKGMNSEQAHIEADKWASRLMGDRSLGQLPHLFESKMLGLVTKFQLEVRNQLDSMFYDTIQEAKASNKDIENALARNAKTAAKVASTFFGLAVSQHLFGKVFESIAGYNPAFDIIDVIAKTFGLDDDDDSEDTVLDNVEQGFLALLEDLPYTSTLSGGRIPISSALPITEFIKGKDEYGNEKSRLKTLSEAAPYYILPGGYGQIKKTAKGLSMFDDDHPVSGSYTDSGNLRFPVEDTVPNRIQAALFGQWANENARDYIENKRKALSPKQVDEYVSSGMTIGDYWDYREGLSGLSKIEEQAAYINGLDIPVWKKNLLINNLTDRKDPISMEEYATYGSIAESDFAKDNPARYELLKRDGVTYEQYQAFDDSKKNAYSWAAKNPEKYEFIESLGYTVDDYAEASDDEKDAWTWAYNNPEKYEVSKAITGDLFEYFQYKKEINAVEGKKDANGKTISGSLKDNVEEYIANMDIDYGAKLLLFKMTYPKDDTYNNDVIDYLNSRDDLNYEQIVTILKELGITW